jgi:hypothetical protein
MELGLIHHRGKTWTESIWERGAGGNNWTKDRGIERILHNENFITCTPHLELASVFKTKCFGKEGAMWRRVRIPPPQPWESWKATEMEPGTWDITGYHWGTWIQGSGPAGWGSDPRLTTLLSRERLLLRNPNKQKSDVVIHVNGQVWLNLLRKVMNQKGLFFQWWW